MGKSLVLIRKIHPGELDLLLTIIHSYAEEAAETLPEIANEISDEIILQNVRNWTIQHNYFLEVAFEGSKAVGFIAGSVIQLPWSNAFQANINFIYMLESHRSMDNFKALLNKFEEWARQAKATRMFSGDIGINIERSRKIYEYLGFTERLFVSKDLK
jgi:GNAT superfamily N-acetyltransferase